ncbi:hypothetical protein RJ641_022724, partial [Dillenia turbinata]
HCLSGYSGPICSVVKEVSKIRDGPIGTGPAAIAFARHSGGDWTAAGIANLHLDENEFNKTFSENIANLSNLEVWTLAYNELFVPSPIPEKFGNLRNLKYLWMTSANLIGGIPESFGNLVNLDLAMNFLTGSIPDSNFSSRI